MTKNKSKLIVLLALSLLWASLAQGQQSFNASGGNATGIGGTASYSIGQLVYTTTTGSNGNVAQGVQHAYVISTTGVNETDLSISLSVFPNPIVDNLTLQISDYTYKKLSYQLVDVQGNMLNSGQIVALQTLIDMKNLPQAAYFVNVVNQENKKVKSFKIIKN